MDQSGSNEPQSQRASTISGLSICDLNPRDIPTQVTVATVLFYSQQHEEYMPINDMLVYNVQSSLECTRGVTCANESKATTIVN